MKPSSSQFPVAALLYTSIFLFNGVSGITFTIINDCNFTVWPGFYGSPAFNTSGFELTESNSRSFEIESWNGYLWGRTGCTFNASGHGSCVTGDCGTGEMECRNNRINGQIATPPATHAFFGISPPKDNRGFFDVSIAEGYNLQMLVEATNGSGSCSKRGCVNDLSQRCPMELKSTRGGGCMSACQAFGSPEYCCNTTFATTSNCESNAYARFFKSACPRSSIIMEPGGTSCMGADYTVTFCPPVDAFSTIKLGGQLISTDQLVSISGNFTLGFFGEDYRYLGIWYTNDVQSRKVWVANPNSPIVSTLGVHALSIHPDTGNLIITAGGKTLMTITDVQVVPNKNLTAILEDNGNFLLINEIDKKVLWQSFDHPTNVLLPGMKLGSDIGAGRNWTLTSWLSNETPNSGAFTLSWESIEEKSQTLVIRRQGQPYWTGGDLNDQKFQYIFALNGPDSQSQYNLTSVYDNEEQYFIYQSGDNVSLPMWILTPKGQITDGENSIVWTPEFCYGYSSGNGCVESGLPQCRGNGDIFSGKNGEFFPTVTRNATDDNSSLGITDCFIKCWNDCNCVGFNSSTTNGTGCVIWTGSNNFSVNPRDNQMMKYVIEQNRIYPSTGKNLNWIWILIGVAIPLIFLSLLLLWYIKKRKQVNEKRKRDEYFLELTASESFQDVHQLEANGPNGNDLLLFSLASIMDATDDFSVENKLGQGGFGPVYKGKLSDGREIAVKRLSRTSGQGLMEFKNELVLIAKLQHTNLVRVLGCCVHKEEKMLIYEYMPNKSLDFFLFDENKKAEMDWPKRFNIIEGIAQGLLYLHKYSRMRVIHRDLKANNILLDENMNPKISDFGMARIFKQNETHAMTNRVVGTYGYMPPEYAMEGAFSIKSDIFSFGVLILETVTGRRNSSFVHLDRTFNLIEYAWELWRQGDTLGLMDPTLGSTYVLQQFLRTVHVALLCVQESATDRPTTSDMISMLLNETILLPTPNRPAYVIGREETSSTSNESKPKDFSVNNMTVTVMEGR